MSLHTVSLPEKKKATFPDRCFVCETEHPETKLEVPLINPALNFLAGPVLSFLDRDSETLPVCPRCWSRYQFQRWTKAIPKLMVFVAMLVGAVTSSIRKESTLMWVTILAGSVLLVILELSMNRVWPDFIRIIDSGEYTDYQFHSMRYSDEFKILNDDEKTVS